MTIEKEKRVNWNIPQGPKVQYHLIGDTVEVVRTGDEIKKIVLYARELLSYAEDAKARIEELEKILGNK